MVVNSIQFISIDHNHVSNQNKNHNSKIDDELRSIKYAIEYNLIIGSKLVELIKLTKI